MMKKFIIFIICIMLMVVGCGRGTSGPFLPAKITAKYIRSCGDFYIRVLDSRNYSYDFQVTEKDYDKYVVGRRWDDQEDARKDAKVDSETN